MNTKVRKNSGFTLIELLIVIGLLGALSALILPSLMADRETALGDICDYNQAGTVRVLTQYRDMFGRYPADLHTGLDGTGGSAVAMDGLPDAQDPNMGSSVINNTRHDLTDHQNNSLNTAGIDSICSGDGLTPTPLALVANPTGAGTGINVARCTDQWMDDTPALYTFDGRNIAGWETYDGNGIVVCLWVAPTTNWTVGSGDNSDWTKGTVELGIGLEGQCPIPVAGLSGGDPEFAYYMAYFKVFDDGTAATLIGTSCPECGVLNP